MFKGDGHTAMVYFEPGTYLVNEVSGRPGPNFNVAGNNIVFRGDPDNPPTIYMKEPFCTDSSCTKASKNKVSKKVSLTVKLCPQSDDNK